MVEIRRGRCAHADTLPPSLQSTPLDLNLSNIIDEEMTNMSEVKKGTHRGSCAVITVRDPDGEPVDIHGQETGTLEIRTEARNYDFKVVLEKADGSPFLGPKRGSLTKPVVLRIPKKSKGTYVVKVTHHHKHPKKNSSPPPPDVLAFNVHPCPGCPP